MTGTVFNIQRYSLHDGPGVRTVVFLKGCPLRCRWCCNPESQNPQPEIFYLSTKCIGQGQCGLCKSACPLGAVSFDDDGKAVIHRENLSDINGLAASCPSKALRVEGRSMSLDEILTEVESDSVFYRGEGGATWAGGKGGERFEGGVAAERLGG